MRLFLSQTDSPPFQASVSPRRAVLGTRLMSNISRSATDSICSGVLMFTFPGQVSPAPCYILLHQHGCLRPLRVRLDQSLALWSFY